SELEQTAAQHAHETANATIHNVLSSRRDQLGEAIQSLPFVPSTPELDEIGMLIQDVDDSRSPRRLCQLFRHESPQVRLLALKKVKAFVTTHRPFHNSAAIDNYASKLLESLLILARSETDPSVRSACAACLGELGAIDPAKVQVDLTH